MRPFSQEEFDSRLRRVREVMAERRLDACIITNPENVFYLTGLNHQGYFAYTSLILPIDGEPALVIRAMEQAIVGDTLRGVRPFPYSDGVEPIGHQPDALPGLDPHSMSIGVSIRSDRDRPPEQDAPIEATCRALHALRLSRARVGFERSGSFLPYRIAQGFTSAMPDVTWLDADDVVDECRSVQSPAELRYTRRAAEISDAMVMTGMAVAGPGVSKQDVTASVYQVMIQRGGTYPAFVPLIRSTNTIAHEHGTWDPTRLRHRDLLFLEMAGCRWRYHAPVGRLVYIGAVNRDSQRIHAVALEALHAAAGALRPGAVAGEVYDAWQAVVDRAGLSHYRRHHCGYMVGIGFPPSWSGSGVPRGLRRGSRLLIRPGMVFHLMSWVLRTGQGDAFFSDTVTVTESGCEFLTRAPRDLLVR